jgi:hypothetical protein
VEKKSGGLAEAGNSNLVGSVWLQWGKLCRGGGSEKFGGEREIGEVATAGGMGSAFSK